jgi:Protein of unknown function (DUF3995)
VPAYAAFAWAAVFAALSFYWAAGGDGLVTTLAHTLRADAAKRDAGFVAILYATAVLKLAAAALAISLARPLAGAPATPRPGVGGRGRPDALRTRG